VVNDLPPAATVQLAREIGAALLFAPRLLSRPAQLDALKRTHPAIHEGIIQAYSHAIDWLFFVAVPVSVLSVIAALFINQVRLRASNAQTRLTVEPSVAVGEDAVTAATEGTH
jgi:hypothetical protein